MRSGGRGAQHLEAPQYPFYINLQLTVGSKKYCLFSLFFIYSAS